MEIGKIGKRNDIKKHYENMEWETKQTHKEQYNKGMSGFGEGPKLRMTQVQI